MIAENLLKQIEEGRSGKNIGFSMGLPKFETIVDGVTQSTYTLVFSPSGTGKTSFTLFAYVYKPLMDHLYDDNFKISYYSLEMSAELLFVKLLSLYIFETYGIELSAKELLSRQKGFILSDEYYQIVLESMSWLKLIESKITIYDKACNAKSLYTTLLKELTNSGKFEETDKRKIYIPNNPSLVHLVIIDHLSLVRPSDGRSLKEEMDLISSYLVTLRNMCKVSPLVIMQANRDSGGMERRKQGLNNMRLNDTKDSGGPVQDAEIVISLFSPHREHLATYNKYDIKILQHNFRAATILKNRYGEADVEVGLNFFGKCGYFHELPRPEDIYDYFKYTNPDYIIQPDNEEEPKDTHETSLKFTL